MKPQIFPNSFTDKIADAKERRRIAGSPLTSPERHAANDLKLERELHKMISNELLRRGIYFIHSRMDRKSTQAKGVPDFIFAINGYPVAIECKTPSGVMSDDQALAACQMRANGWHYSVVRSFTELLDVIHGIANRIKPYDLP